LRDVLLEAGYGGGVGLPFLTVPLIFAIVFDWPLGALWPYAIILLLVGALAVLLPTIERWQTRRAFAAAPEFGDLTYRFTEAGFQLTTPVSSSELKWNGVNEAVEIEDMFLFFIGRNSAYYIPKRIVGRAPIPWTVCEWG
jgi:hypothetical protein